MRIIILKNPQGSSDTWNGQLIGAGATHAVQNDQERGLYAIDSKVNQDIWSSPAKLVINDGTNDLSPEAGDRWLKEIDDKLDADGFRVISPTYEYNHGLQALWCGHLFTATAGQLSIFDTLISTEMKAQGGWYEVVGDPAAPDAVVGDYMELSIIDKDDTLGLFGILGLTVGTDILELGKFLKTEYINPYAANLRQVFLSRGTFDVMAGLYFRTYYNSIGNNDVKMKVSFYVHEEP